MKNKQFLYYLLIFTLFINIISCENVEKFLKEEPSTFYIVDNAFSSSAQIDQIMIAVYSQMRDLWANPNEEGWIFVFRGNGTDMYDVPSIRRGNTFNNYGNINPDNGNFYNIYSTWYQMISRANLAIHAAGLPQISWTSDSEKTYTLAQARFFRAFAYKNLAELFGGVPIVTEITLVPLFNYERATRVQTYQFAIDELLEIENDLPETSSSGGRLVKGAAQHNLCELYLALGTQLASEGKNGEAQSAFAQSVAYGNKVIDGGTYSLMTARFGARKTEAVGNVYWDLFQENSVNYQDGNKECIWSLQVDYASYKAEDKKSKLPYSRTFGAVFRDGSSGHLTGTLEDVGGRGVAQLIPTMYSRDSIYAGIWGEDMRNSDIVFRRIFYGNVAPTTAKPSPYYQLPVPWSVMYSNDNNRSLCYPISCKIATDKYTGLADGENRSNLFRDDYIIRLPETILLRAEAKQRMGDKNGTADDINLLRSRSNCTYLVSASDVDDNFNLILDERTRELVYEECRWNTLLRMGGTIAVERIKKYAYWPEAKATLTFDYNVWPIPQTIIDTNKDKLLEQNPGWTDR